MQQARSHALISNIMTFERQQRRRHELDRKLTCLQNANHWQLPDAGLALVGCGMAKFELTQARKAADRASNLFGILVDNQLAQVAKIVLTEGVAHSRRQPQDRRVLQRTCTSVLAANIN